MSACFESIGLSRTRTQAFSRTFTARTDQRKQGPPRPSKIFESKYVNTTSITIITGLSCGRYRMSDKATDNSYVAVDRPWKDAWGVWTKCDAKPGATKSSPLQQWTSEDQRDRPWNPVEAVKLSNHATQDRPKQQPAISYESDRATKGSQGGRNH